MLRSYVRNVPMNLAFIVNINMRYQHDCDDCKPLGEYGEADLYFCEHVNIYDEKNITVIARYGNDGDDYMSGFSEFIPDLAEAKKRAIAMGWLPADE